MADVFSALKAQQWERAKGELRAQVALLGSQPVEYEPKTARPIKNAKWLAAEEAVEAFIKHFEDHGLHE